MAIIGRGLLGGAATLTAVTLLAACGGGAPGPSTSPPPTSAAVPSSPPAPMVLTDTQYTASLVAIDRPVTAALAKIAAGGSRYDLATASSAASSASSQVVDLPVADAVRSDNLTLSEDLTALSNDLSSLGSGTDTAGDTACAAAVPAVEVGQLDSLSKLAADIRQAAASGHSTGLAVPKFPKQQKRTLATGTYLRDTDRNGNGRLTIENGGSGSAVVTLMRNGTRSFAVYLRKNATYTVRGVRDGTYSVYFATGTDWDAKHKGFTSGCAYEKFDKSLKFTTTYTSRYVRYMTYTLSLYGVVGGTATITGVAPDKFPKP
jgi:hypothetical protein